MLADDAIDRLCYWIMSSKSPQQAGARYRVARGKEYVMFDGDYSRLFDAYNQFLTDYKEERRSINA